MTEEKPESSKPGFKSPSTYINSPDYKEPEKVVKKR